MNSWWGSLCYSVPKLYFKRNKYIIERFKGFLDGFVTTVIHDIRQKKAKDKKWEVIFKKVHFLLTFLFVWYFWYKMLMFLMIQKECELWRVQWTFGWHAPEFVDRNLTNICKTSCMGILDWLRVSVPERRIAIDSSSAGSQVLMGPHPPRPLARANPKMADECKLFVYSVG